MFRIFFLFRFLLNFSNFFFFEIPFESYVLDLIISKLTVVVRQPLKFERARVVDDWQMVLNIAMCSSKQEKQTHNRNRYTERQVSELNIL